MLQRLSRLLGVFVASVFYISLVYHLTNLYATEHHAFEYFILLDGGVYTFLLWFGALGVGTAVPLYLIYSEKFRSQPHMVALACALVIVGGFAWLYVIIIGGQAFPLQLFPGMEVSSSFQDGSVAAYTPSLWEFLLGFGGIATSIVLVSFAARALPLLPVTLADNGGSSG